MKSSLSFIFIFCLFLCSLFISSCEKDDLASPDGSITFRESPAFTLSSNPALPGDSVYVTFNADNGADCGQIHIQISGPDGSGWGNGSKPVTPDSGAATILFVPDAPGEYQVRARYTRTGKPSDCPFESTGWIVSDDLLLVEGDDDGGDGDSTQTDTCDAVFTGEAISCDSTREAVFTFTSDEDLDYVKIQGGLTNFTDEDAVVTIDGAELDVRQRTPGNSSNRIITIEGSVEACVPVTITITWNSTNQGSFITGDWSATGDDIDFTVEPLYCE